MMDTTEITITPQPQPATPTSVLLSLRTALRITLIAGMLLPVSLGAVYALDDRTGIGFILSVLCIVVLFSTWFLFFGTRYMEWCLTYNLKALWYPFLGVAICIYANCYADLHWPDHTEHICGCFEAGEPWSCWVRDAGGSSVRVLATGATKLFIPVVLFYAAKVKTRRSRLSMLLGVALLCVAVVLLDNLGLPHGACNFYE